MAAEAMAAETAVVRAEAERAAGPAEAARAVEATAAAKVEEVRAAARAVEARAAASAAARAAAARAAAARADRTGGWGVGKVGRHRHSERVGRSGDDVRARVAKPHIVQQRGALKPAPAMVTVSPARPTLASIRSMRGVACRAYRMRHAAASEQTAPAMARA